MDGGGGSSAPTTQTIQQNTIAPEAAPYYSSLLGQASALTNINQNPYVQYQGERTAGFAPMQTQAFNALQNMQLPGATGQAGQTAADIAAQGQNYQGYQTGRFGTANANNPWLMQSYMNPYIGTALAPTLQLMQQNAGMQQRALGQQAQRAGAFGGYRQGIQQGVQAGQDALAQGNVIGNMYQQGYGQAAQNLQADMARQLQAQQAREQSRQFGAGLGLQGLNTALQAAGLQGQMGQQQYAQQMGLNQAQQLAGAQQQALEQQRMNVGYQDFLNQQNWPYKNLAFMSDVIGRPLQNTSTSIYQAPPTAGQSLLGLGMGAYGLSQMVKAKGGIVNAFDNGGWVQKDFLAPKKTDKSTVDPAMLAGIAAADPQAAIDAANAYKYDQSKQQFTKVIQPTTTTTGATPAMDMFASGPGPSAADSAGPDAAAAAADAAAAAASAGPGDGDGSSGERRGGLIKYSQGGSAISTLNTLSKLPPDYLRRMQQYQPLTGMVQQSNKMLETAKPVPAEAQLGPPQMEQGITQARSGNMEFADGGIVGYADGGDTEDVIPTKIETPFSRARQNEITGMLTPWDEVEKRVRAGNKQAIEYAKKRLAAGPGIIGWTPPESLVNYMEGFSAGPPAPPLDMSEEYARTMKRQQQALDRRDRLVAERKAREEAAAKRERAAAAGPAVTPQSTTASGIAGITEPVAPPRKTPAERVAESREYMEGVRDPDTEALIEKLGAGIGEVSRAQKEALDRSMGAAWLKAGAAALTAGQPGIMGALARAGESLGTSAPQIEHQRAAAAEWRQKAEQAQTQAQIQYRKGNVELARAMAHDAELADDNARKIEAQIYGAKMGYAGHQLGLEGVKYAADKHLQGALAQARATGDYREVIQQQNAMKLAEAAANAELTQRIKGTPLESLDRNDPQITNMYNDILAKHLRAHMAALKKGANITDLLGAYGGSGAEAPLQAGWQIRPK